MSRATLPYAVPYQPVTSLGSTDNPLTTKEGRRQAPRLPSLCEGNGMAKRPEPSPRLSMPLRIAAHFESDQEAGEAVARSRATRAHWHATQGDLAPLVALLRDAETALDQLARDTAADAIEGKLKRGDGRPAERAMAMQRWEAARLFVVLTAHLGLRKKRAKGRLADFYGCGDGTVAEWLTSERARLGPEKWADMEAKAGDHFDFLCEAFHDNEQLRYLLRPNG